MAQGHPRDQVAAGRRTPPASLKVLAPGSRFSAGIRACASVTSVCQTARTDAFPVMTSARKPGVPFFDEEALHLAVGTVTCPYHGNVGEAGVADPAFVPADDVLVPVLAGGRLQRHRIRAVQRLGQREGAECVQPGQPGKPALPLLLRAEQVDRLHHQPGLDSEEGTQAAVTAVDLHVDQAGGQRAHGRRCRSA